MIIECFNTIKFDAYIFLKNKNYHRQFIDEKKKKYRYKQYRSEITNLLKVCKGSSVALHFLTLHFSKINY